MLVKKSEPSVLDPSEAVDILNALAHPARLEVFRLLIRYLPYGLAAGDIARLLAVPHNTLSGYLAMLERAGLIQSRREGRSIIFAAIAARSRQIATYLSGGDSDPSVAVLEPSPVFPARRDVVQTKKMLNVLVVCTGNSARSIFAEAILAKEGAGRFRPYSAGSRPRAQPQALALALLDQLGYDISNCRTKSWNEFARPDSPPLDIVVTVCDLAARMPCPSWPGQPLMTHWGVPDPAAIAGSQTEKRAAFLDAYRRLAARVTALINLDLETPDHDQIARKLAAIGGMEGATDLARRRAAA